MLHQLAPNYIDTGKAKVVFKNFAFIGQESIDAAQASECANEQGQFWPYADYLLTHQAGENAGAFSQDNLKAFAAKISGIDTAKFNACVDSRKYKDAVQKETDEGRSRGVQATPTFFVNGQKIEGLLQAAQFGQLIDSLNH